MGVDLLRLSRLNNTTTGSSSVSSDLLRSIDLGRLRLRFLLLGELGGLFLGDFLGAVTFLMGLLAPVGDAVPESPPAAFHASISRR